MLLLQDGGFTKLFDSILAAHPNVDCQNKFGMTALMIAVQGGYISEVESLLKTNVKVNLRDQVGNTALYYAKENAQRSSSTESDFKIVQMIRDAGGVE